MLFNVIGVAVFYPIPFVRRIPVRLAERLAELATAHRLVVGAYVLGVFLFLPLAGIVLLR